MKVLQQLTLHLQDLTNRAYYRTSKLQIQRNCLSSSNRLLMKNYVSAQNPGSVNKLENRLHISQFTKKCININKYNYSNTWNVNKSKKLNKITHCIKLFVTYHVPIYRTSIHNIHKMKSIILPYYWKIPWLQIIYFSMMFISSVSIR